MNLINWLTSPVAEALGWTLIHALWQGFAVVLSVALLLYLTRSRRAALRYQIGMSGLLIQVLVSAITFGWYYEPGQAVGLLTSGAGPSFVGFSATANPSVPIQVQAFLNAHLPEIVWAWLVGVGLFGVRLVGGWAYIQRLRKTATLPVPAALTQATERIAGKLNVTARVQVTARVTGPMVVGILKPVVLWPVGLLAGLSAADVEAVLAHELAHIRRHDYLFNVLQSVVEVVYFFHPALWWLSARVREEREHCCDDVAVQLIGDARVLARALARVEAWQREAEEVPALAMAFASKRQLLLQRVRRMLGVPTRPLVNNTSLVGLTLVTLLLLSISVYAVGRVEEPKPAEAEKPNYSKQGLEVKQVIDDKLLSKDATTDSVRVSINGTFLKPTLSRLGMEGIDSLNVNGEIVMSSEEFARVVGYKLASKRDTTRLRAAQQQLEALTKQMQAIMAERQPIIDRLSKEMAELTLKNKGWQNQTGPLAKQMGELGRQQAELARKMVPLQAEMARLSRQNTAKANQLIRQKEQQTDQLEKQMNQLEKQMEKLGKQMEPIQQNLEPYHQRLSMLADSIGRLVEPTTELSEKIGELSGQIAEEANEQAEEAMRMAEDALQSLDAEESRPARAPRASSPARVPRPPRPAKPALPGRPALPAPPDAVDAPEPRTPAVAPRALSPKSSVTPKAAPAPKSAVAPKAQ